MSVTTTTTNNPSGEIKITKVISGETAVVFTNLVDIVKYEIICSTLVPSSAGANLILRGSTDNGSTYDSGNNYQWGSQKTSMAAVSVVTASGSNADSSIHVLDALSTGGATAIDIDCHSLGTAAYPSFIFRAAKNENGGVLYSVTGAGYYVPGSPPTTNAIQLSISTGTLSGTFTLRYIVI